MHGLQRNAHWGPAVAVWALCLVGCSSEERPLPDDGATQTDFATGGDGHCPDSFRPTNDAFCYSDACQAAPDCRLVSERPADSCCVLVRDPPGGAARAHLALVTDTTDFASPSGGLPDLSCFEPANYPAKPSATTETAKLQGAIEAFANGCDLVGVRVEIYTVKRTGNPATDGQPDQLVGTPLETTSAMEIEPEVVDNCVDPRKNRKYVYPGVPMNTELLVKTSGANPDDELWADLYMYNLYISADDPDFDAATGVYNRNLPALASGDFNLIPTVAISRTISAGNGAIGGEIHDCNNYRVRNALVDVSSGRAGVVYFDDNETSPLPDVNRSAIGTGRTALYSALDVKPSIEAPVRVSAVGLVPAEDGDKLVSLGYFDARVFPNAVSSVTLRGLRPFQVP